MQVQLQDIVENGRFIFSAIDTNPSFTLFFHNTGEEGMEISWTPEEVQDFAVAVQFNQKGGDEHNALLFRLSIKVCQPWHWHISLCH